MRLAYSEGLGFFCERIDIRKISLESSAVEKIGNSEFQQKAPNYYNFDVIISISLSDEMTIKATTKSVVKYLEAIKKKHREEILFACGYEAGPTGYGLCRGLQKAGFGCAVMAPTTMSNPEGKRRVKTVVEIHDFTRFATAAQFVSYLGLCPGEDSSGKTKNMLSLTKAGNCRVRALFCESVKAIKRTNSYGQKSKRILERQKNASPEIVAYADKITKRIRTKMKHLEERGKNYNVSSAAGARELACFVWGMMNGKIA